MPDYQWIGCNIIQKWKGVSDVQELGKGSYGTISKVTIEVASAEGTHAGLSTFAVKSTKSFYPQNSSNDLSSSHTPSGDIPFTSVREIVSGALLAVSSPDTSGIVLGPLDLLYDPVHGELHSVYECLSEDLGVFLRRLRQFGAEERGLCVAAFLDAQRQRQPQRQPQRQALLAPQGQACGSVRHWRLSCDVEDPAGWPCAAADAPSAVSARGLPLLLGRAAAGDHRPGCLDGWPCGVEPHTRLSRMFPQAAASPGPCPGPCPAPRVPSPSAAARLPHFLVQSLLFQLLRGLRGLHALGVLHRDIKPANLLLDAHLRVKIGDLGLARFWSGGGGSNGHDGLHAFTQEVQTQWYRAPEVLLGLGAYSPAVDVWSLGCVFGELLLGRPLFQGDSEIGQLVQICKLLGTPTEAQWPGWTQLPHALAAFPRFPPPPAAVLQQTLFPPPCPACGGADGLEAVEQHALDLLKQMLCFNPVDRITAEAAICHPYFFL